MTNLIQEMAELWAGCKWGGLQGIIPIGSTHQRGIVSSSHANGILSGAAGKFRFNH
jgi:hypothetical protein